MGKNDLKPYFDVEKVVKKMTVHMNLNEKEAEVFAQFIADVADFGEMPTFSELYTEFQKEGLI